MATNALYPGMEHKARPKNTLAFNRTATLNNLALMTAPYPGIGDVAGLAADANMYASDPASRNWKNYLMTGLGVLPFVPAIASLGKATKSAPMPANQVGAIKPTYGGGHRPPGRHYGAPAHDVTNLLPDDIYGPNAVRYYGHMGAKMDGATLQMMRALRGNPDAEVTIYRAIPKDTPADAGIGAGDWVTITKEYARSHGDSALEGNYRIVESKVKAKDLYTSGDSIHEWGYDPE